MCTLFSPNASYIHVAAKTVKIECFEKSRARVIITTCIAHVTDSGTNNVSSEQVNGASTAADT